MIHQDRRYRYLIWIIFGILTFLFIYLLVKTYPFYSEIFSFLWRLLIPFIIASLIAYLLYPVIEKLDHYNIHRGIAILFIYILFFGGVGFLIYRIYPQVIHQVRDLTNNFPLFMDMYRNSIQQVYNFTSFLPENVHDKMDDIILGIENSLDILLSKLISGFTRIFDMVIVITVIPVLVFYFLKDYDKMKNFVKGFIPHKFVGKTSEVIHAIDDSLGKYIRGQLIVCLFVSITSMLIFKLLDLEYALLLAIVMGITNIIPYFGPILGAIPAVIIAYTTTGQIKLIFFVLIGILVIQIIEGNLLSPYIVGKSVAIHPVAIIFALLLGGELFGVIGLIFAVPLLTIGKVIVNHVIAFPGNR
ncbi:AI-2E family transporter [Oceanobacillus piezotolerans]|uniref:AI-2E family transporter n=1 Tax=Oceanobacillus piezotolerans TaxID=2448030 RepID=UPI001FE2CD93|nr:AI-2E family transporter [Oceanobacillus piezotolerans]